MNKIEALEQALAAATPGEWTSSWNFILADDPSGKHVDIYLFETVESDEEGRYDSERCEANAELVVLMKNTLPDLLEAVKALHRISLSSQNSATSKEALGKEARAALAKLRGDL